jgi:GTP-binding protein Era
VNGDVTRSGLIALAGRPNVGKSTLVNRLVGDRVAAVSALPQTTRRRSLGAVTRRDAQLVLVDLPGFQTPFDRLTERMQRSVDEALADADGTLLVLDATEPIGGGDRFVAARVLGEPGRPCVIALNKVDRLRPPAIAAAIQAAARLGPFHALHPISALTGDGVEALLGDLLGLLDEGPAYFPPGATSDQTDEQRIAEAVREAALSLTRQEVPHAIGVLVDEIERTKGHAVVRATLICETESQKGILIGKGGAMIKRIGVSSRPAVEHVLDGPVHLDLRVKVRRHWRRDESELDRLGV